MEALDHLKQDWTKNLENNPGGDLIGLFPLQFLTLSFKPYFRPASVSADN